MDPLPQPPQHPSQPTVPVTTHEVHHIHVVDHRKIAAQKIVFATIVAILAIAVGLWRQYSRIAPALAPSSTVR